MDRTNAHERLFGDTLTVSEVRPASFEVGPIDAATRHSALAKAETMLAALAIVDDARHDDPDDHNGAIDSYHRRVEAKLDVLTALISGLIRARGECDPEQSITWSAKGVMLNLDRALQPGDEGTFSIQPSERVPYSISLPARVLSCVDQGEAGSEVILEFVDRTPAFAESLHRHLFRVDRRAIADKRRQELL